MIFFITFIKTTIIYSILMGISIFPIYVESSIKVDFQIPTEIKKNIPYSLFIKNTDSQESFPFVNFVLAFEMRSTITKFNIGVIPVSSRDFVKDTTTGFAIEKFRINANIITAVIIFREEAYDNKFILRYGSAQTDEERLEFYNNYTRGIIYETEIKMYLPYTITMNVMPDIGVIDLIDKSDFGPHLIAEKDGLITCQAEDGKPKRNPDFVNADILRAPIIKVMTQGMISLSWKVLLEDHGKIIRCQAGNDVKNVTLKIYHYVTEVLTSPPISTMLPRNSQVKCISKDGFPASKMSWVFINGPPYAWKSYQLRDNNVTLFINYSAPISSNWTFECRGMNEMPRVAQKYLLTANPNYPLKKVYNFTVIDTTDSVQSSQAGVVAALVILFIIVAIVVILCVMNRMMIRDYCSTHYSRVFKSENEHEKSLHQNKETGYIYSEGSKGNSHPNGTEEIDYASIVGIVQSKSAHDATMGPIDLV